MKTICINCPLGCPLEITEHNGQITVKGNTCNRGRDYGISEYTRPVRTVTTLVRSTDGRVFSVKTSAPVPKDRVFDILERMREIVVPADSAIGDTAEENALGLSVDIIVTGVPAPRQ